MSGELMLEGDDATAASAMPVLVQCVTNGTQC